MHLFEQGNHSNGVACYLVVSTDAFTAPRVRLSSPRVRIENKATIAGELVYTELVSVAKKATIAHEEQVGLDHWPLFQEFALSAFLIGAPGEVDIEVKKNQTLMLDPLEGSFGQIKVKQKGTLIFISRRRLFPEWMSVKLMRVVE